MKRRYFLRNMALGGGLVLSNPLWNTAVNTTVNITKQVSVTKKILEADAVIIGAGLGGLAAAFK